MQRRSVATTRSSSSPRACARARHEATPAPNPLRNHSTTPPLKAVAVANVTMLIRAPPPPPGTRPGWPEEAGRADEWVDWWGADLVQGMKKRSVTLPHGMRISCLRPVACGGHGSGSGCVPNQGPGAYQNELCRPCLRGARIKLGGYWTVFPMVTYEKCALLVAKFGLLNSVQGPGGFGGPVAAL